MRGARGFTLTEMAVVLVIVAFLMASAMYTLSAQTEQRNFEETRRRLELARELLLSYAIVNGRLPCPATAASAGDEAPAGGGPCTTYYGGWLPARTIGYQVVDAGGYAVDPWAARIRYALINNAGVALTGCAVSNTQPHFTNTVNLKANGITCQPNGLVVCRSATGITTTCGPAANAITNLTTVVAIVYSVGKNNAAIGSGGIDEAANINGDAVFVSHPPAPVGATNGEFDDQLQWITVGELYGKLISAGVLP